MTNSEIEITILKSATEIIKALAESFKLRAYKVSDCCGSTLNVFGQCEACEEYTEEILTPEAQDLVEQAYAIADTAPLSQQAVYLANRLSSETL